MDPGGKAVSSERAASTLHATWDELEPGLAAAGGPAILLDNRGRIRFSVPASWQGHTLRQHTVEEDQDGVLAAFRHAMHPGVAQTVVARMRDPEGKVTWSLWHFAPAPGGVLATLRDVDELKRTSIRVDATSALLRDTEEMADMGVWYWDVSKPHAEWSSHMYQIYGLDPATHTPSYEDYLRRVHPDDVDRVKAATEGAFHDGRPYSHDERIRRSDGQWRHLHTWGRPVLDEGGSLIALQGVCMDITDRKEAELETLRKEIHLQAIFDATSIGFAVLDADGGVTDTNAAFLRMLPEGTVARDRCFEDLFEPGSRPAVAALVAAAQMPGARHGGLDVALAGEDAGWVRMRVNRVLGPGAPFLLAVMEDVTVERTAAERQEEIERLTAEGQQQKRLLDIAAHELKNPLTPLLVRLYLLRTGGLGGLTDRQADALRQVESQAKRLEGLVQDLLDVGRLHGGRGDMAIADVDLKAAARGAMEVFTEQARKWGVTLRLDAPEAARARADGMRLDRVLWNLLSNALKFTATGSTVTVRVRGDDATWVVVEVEDEGPGMPDDATEHAFDAYWQGPQESTRAATGGGAGLGLYVCRALVEAQGGQMGVRPAPDKGSVFWFRLPAA